MKWGRIGKVTEDKITEEYLSNFPTVFHEALKNEAQVRNKFIKTIQEDYHELKVYRAIQEEKSISENDFLSYAEIAVRDGKPYKKKDLAWYSVSVNTDKEQIITSMNIPNEERKLLGIASGMMKSEYGPADFSDYKTHHNWYLYKNAKIWLKDEFVVEKIEKERDNTTNNQLAGAL